MYTHTKHMHAHTHIVVLFLVNVGKIAVWIIASIYALASTFCFNSSSIAYGIGCMV